jgi:hypothetical protein
VAVTESFIVVNISETFTLIKNRNQKSSKLTLLLFFLIIIQYM